MSILSKILLNGKQYSGKNVRVEVIIDGERINLSDSPKIDIVVHGNLEALEVNTASSIQVDGTVGDLKTGSADVKCGNVQGNVATGSGDIECGMVGGNVVTASGDVACYSVGGNVKTASGDINVRG